MTKPSPAEAKADLPALHLPDGRQAALLLLRLFELRDGARNKPMTRARLTPPMLKRFGTDVAFRRHFFKTLLTGCWSPVGCSSTPGPPTR